VLERQEQYQDQVRGEYLVPWGVQEAERLELDEVLLEAGGHRSEAFVFHDPPEGSDEATEAVGYAEVTGRLGRPMAFGHPAACEALAKEAGHRGASVVRGVTSVEVVPGARPSVSYQHAGRAQQIECRLVVGADGRSSRVRRQAGIALQRAAQVHMVAGLLVEDLHVDPSQDVFGIGDDVFMITFVQGGGRARLYLCWASVGPLVARTDAERAARQAHLQQAEADFDPLPFDAAAARAFGQVAASLRRAGRKPAARSYDAMIAAVAIANDLPPYTSNPDGFATLEQLRVVDVPHPTARAGLTRRLRASSPRREARHPTRTPPVERARVHATVRRLRSWTRSSTTCAAPRPRWPRCAAAARDRRTSCSPTRTPCPP
jgi:tRNA(fMet)-specific endonuclease VapC